MKQGWLQKANINSSLSVSMRVSHPKARCVIPERSGKNRAEKMWQCCLIGDISSLTQQNAHPWRIQTCYNSFYSLITKTYQSWAN